MENKIDFSNLENFLDSAQAILMQKIQEADLDSDTRFHLEYIEIAILRQQVKEILEKNYKEEKNVNIQNHSFLFYLGSYKTSEQIWKDLGKIELPISIKAFFIEIRRHIQKQITKLYAEEIVKKGRDTLTKLNIYSKKDLLNTSIETLHKMGKVFGDEQGIKAFYSGIRNKFYNTVGKKQIRELAEILYQDLTPQEEEKAKKIEVERLVKLRKTLREVEIYTKEDFQKAGPLELKRIGQIFGSYGGIYSLYSKLTYKPTPGYVGKTQLQELGEIIYSYLTEEEEKEVQIIEESKLEEFREILRNLNIHNKKDLVILGIEKLKKMGQIFGQYGGIISFCSAVCKYYVGKNKDDQLIIQNLANKLFPGEEEQKEEKSEGKSRGSKTENRKPRTSLKKKKVKIAYEAKEYRDMLNALDIYSPKDLRNIGPYKLQIMGQVFGGYGIIAFYSKVTGKHVIDFLTKNLEELIDVLYEGLTQEEIGEIQKSELKNIEKCRSILQTLNIRDKNDLLAYTPGKLFKMGKVFGEYGGIISFYSAMSGEKNVKFSKAHIENLAHILFD